MKRRIQWSRAALDDLKNQIAYIATDNPEAAQRVAKGIRAAVEGLASIPTGRPGRVAGTYEKSVTRLPYIVAYVLDDDAVSIIRVIHSARDWPAEGWPG